MKIRAEQATCAQCHCDLTDTTLYCPNCGARRKEDTVQVAVRRLRGAALSALVAAVAAAGATGILGVVFSGWPAAVARKFPLLPSTFAMHLLGMLLGGMIGAVVYALKEFARDPE